MYNGVYQWVEAGQLNVDDMVCTVKGYGFVIVSQPSEPKQVYNIAVLEDESYIANGIVVHNCRSGLVPVPITKEIDKNMIFENRDFSGVLDDSAKVDKAFENIDKFNDKYRISKYFIDQDLAARMMFEKGVSVSLRVEVPKKSISNNTPSLLMDGLKTKDIITLHDTLIENYGGTSGTRLKPLLITLFSIN